MKTNNEVKKFISNCETIITYYNCLDCLLTNNQITSEEHKTYFKQIKYLGNLYLKNINENISKNIFTNDLENIKLKVYDINNIINNKTTLLEKKYSNITNIKDYQLGFEYMKKELFNHLGCEYKINRIIEMLKEKEYRKNDLLKEYCTKLMFKISTTSLVNDTANDNDSLFSMGINTDKTDFLNRLCSLKEVLEKEYSNYLQRYNKKLIDDNSCNKATIKYLESELNITEIQKYHQEIDVRLKNIGLNIAVLLGAFVAINNFEMSRIYYGIVLSLGLPLTISSIGDYILVRDKYKGLLKENQISKVK